MNNYIVLDSYKYATLARSWSRVVFKPHTERYTLLGSLDVTYGASAPIAWEGEIVAPVAARAEGWGTIETLAETLAKKEAVDFKDHHGNEVNVHVLGSHDRHSLMNNWDDPNNVFYVEVRLVVE